MELVRNDSYYYYTIQEGVKSRGVCAWDSTVKTHRFARETGCGGRKAWVERVFAGWGRSKSGPERSKTEAEQARKHSKSGAGRNQRGPGQFCGKVAVSFGGK